MMIISVLTIRGKAAILPAMMLQTHAISHRMLPVMFIVAVLTGCANQRTLLSYDQIAGDAPATVLQTWPEEPEPRRLPMFLGRDGAPVDWDGLMRAVAWADVVILGEQHDDALGHAVQLAIVEDALARWPRSVVSMEMLERDEQVLVDDYFDDVLDAASLARLTFSESWAGEGSWFAWYQPIIDAAKHAGSRVVAANAPRRYVRLARTEGYEQLQSLPPSRRKYFDVPGALPEGAYRQRFFEVMSHGESGDEEEGDSEAGGHPIARNTDHLLPIFRSQLVWDATMAASIARAKRSGATKVLHLVGQFHSDFDGGLVIELRKRLPGARILVISMQRDDAVTLLDHDRGRADIVIYTGKWPEPEEEAPAEEAEEHEHVDEAGDDGAEGEADAAALHKHHEHSE